MQYKLGSFLPKVRHYVEIRADATLTKDLQTAKVLFLDFAFEGPNGPTFYWVFPRERQWEEEIDELLPHLRNQTVQAVRVIVPNDTDFLSETAVINDLPPSVSLSFLPIANTVPTNAAKQVLEFAEIARQSAGAEYLAALKMDVDNFTSIFAEGLVRGATSLAHRMTLSRSFSYFFLGYVNAIARRYPLIDPTGSVIEDSAKLYTVFAGGDDLFLLGPWNVVIDAAWHMRQDFMHYTGNRDNLTISAGVTYCKPTFPIRRFTDLTDEAIGAAKAFKEETQDNKIHDAKDALSLFGEVLHWDRSINRSKGIELFSFDQLYNEFARPLAKLVEESNAEAGVSHAFLMNLLTLKRTSLDQRKMDWKWKLPYLLAQAGVRKSMMEASEKWRLLSRLAEGDGKWFRSLEVPLMWALLKTRRS